MSVTYLQHTVGKRKTSIARLYLKEGEGRITINKKPMDEYYLRPTSKMLISQPLELTGTVGKYDLTVNVVGGGLQGQAGAIRHAISRALADMDPKHREVLKRAGLLTRDARKKERKLPGQPGARRKFQFSKR
ncbi:MAG: 30S ribosomal protein S9 [Zetaproteobacteria bacterium]|nr:30S ribosomal protein S9 [Zetaproteobacteria bacterium]